MTPSRFLVAAMVCALAWPAVASAQDDAFRRGLDARDDKNWNVVIAQMQAALKSDAKESTREVRRGLFGRMEYLPHFFLGEAYFALQQCARAVEEWSISEQQGAVKVRREFVVAMNNGYKTCAASGVLLPAEFTQQQDSTTQVVTEVTAFAERVINLAPADVWTPEMHEQYERVRGELTAAGARLAAGKSSRLAAHFAEARAAAGRATSGLRTLEGSIKANAENITAVRLQIRQVDQLIASAETGDRAIDGVKVELTSELAASRQNGRDLLARARDRVRSGEKTQNLATVNEGMRSAQDAVTVFKDVLDAANKLLAANLESQLRDAVAVAGEAISFLDNSLTTLSARLLGRQPPASAQVTSQLEALQKRAITIRRRFDTAQKTQDVSGINQAARQAAQARTELDALITSLGPATLQDRGVHAALEEGARLFFAGEYQQVLGALDTSELDTAPLQLHVHLFRAAASYYLFVRSGEKDQALRTRAVAEVEACKRLNPGFNPDPRAFAPRFLEFFQNPAENAPGSVAP